MEVDVDGVETDEEVDEGILLFGSNVGQECGLDGVLGGEGFRVFGGLDGDVQLQGLCVDITDIDTTFVGEKDGVVFAGGVDADVKFSVVRMGK